jgi:hypothetical protein
LLPNGSLHGQTLDSLWPILSAPICFKKFLKYYSRAAEKKLNLSAALEYVLLVHRNLLEYSWGHFKLLLESVKCDFEEISNKCTLFLQYFFNFIAGKMANTIAHKITIKEVLKK